MRVHYLQHVSFEGIGAIEDWVWARGHSLSRTELFRAAPVPAAPPDPADPADPADLLDPLDLVDPPDMAAPGSLPTLDDLDLLVVPGGPMNIYEHDKYPWLKAEKAFLKDAIEHGKAVLGICLGVQLLAGVMGGTVTRGLYKEIGWYPVELTKNGRARNVFADFPDTFTALHWHGDTFSIPPGTVHVVSSEACRNQAFCTMDSRVIGLQFHLEETRSSLELLLKNAGHDLIVGRNEPWVATPHGLLAWNAPYDGCRGLLFALLDRMAAAVS